MNTSPKKCEKMEDDLKNIMEDNQQNKMEDDLKNGRGPTTKI
jgi:hypothetical protein